ncbi:hypothetical protein DFJ73DRAFT_249929 [Zopfochytrium polystomum]|nr:hypothetical protein DFJ73DRAFT_249929 [Zopfochytrium polystomum]
MSEAEGVNPNPQLHQLPSSALSQRQERLNTTTAAASISINDGNSSGGHSNDVRSHSANPSIVAAVAVGADHRDTPGYRQNPTCYVSYASCQPTSPLLLPLISPLLLPQEHKQECEQKPHLEQDPKSQLKRRHGCRRCPVPGPFPHPHPFPPPATTTASSFTVPIDLQVQCRISNYSLFRLQERNQLHFVSASEDVALLKEIINHSPYDAKHGKTMAAWAAVAKSLTASLDKREGRKQPDGLACQRRFDKLMEAFEKDTITSMRASGTEEEYDKREKLLQDLSELVSSAKSHVGVC